MKLNHQPSFFDQSQCTYFRSSDIAPAVSDDGNAIEIYDGVGLSRGWGRAFCSSYTILHTRTFVVVLVGYKHKHNGGQGWYYFEKNNAVIVRRTANQLSIRRRRQVLEAYDRLAPSWAKRPFESIQKPKPSALPRHERFKQVAMDADGTFRSVFDGTEYTLGKTKREAVKPEHRGGFYVYPSPEAASNAEFPNASRFADLPRVLLKCEVWGNSNSYGNGKESFSYLKPLAIVS